MYGSIVYGSIVYGSIVYGSIVYGSIVYQSVVYGSIVYRSIVYPSTHPSIHPSIHPLTSFIPYKRAQEIVAELIKSIKSLRKGRKNSVKWHAYQSVLNAIIPLWRANHRPSSDGVAREEGRHRQ